jgi:hypothetical protein
MSFMTLDRLVAADKRSWGRRSYGIISGDYSPSKVCVFVHGWAGDVNGTWLGFPSRLRAAAPVADYLFYGYDSLRASANYSASKFRDFLRCVIENPQAEVLAPSWKAMGVPSVPRPNGFTYGRVVLCCHSLGAVVARKALIDLESQTPGIVRSRDVRMILFAPAHMGSHLAKLAQEFLGISIFHLPLAVATTYASVTLKSLRDLVPGSRALDQLGAANLSLVDSIVKSTGKPPTYLPRVFHGEHDQVVEQLDFPGDPPFDPVDDETHTSICKPRNDYHLPVKELLSLL